MTMTRKTWLKAAAASLTLAATTGVMAQQPTELRVGLIPSEDAQAMMRASQQVMDQLAAKTGLKIKPFVANDYNGVIEAMRSGKIDVAYFGPFSYVLASQLATLEPLGDDEPGVVITTDGTPAQVLDRALDALGQPRTH